MSKLTGKVADVTGASKGMEPLSPSHSPAGDRARVIANIRVLRFGTTSGNRRKQSRNSQDIFNEKFILGSGFTSNFENVETARYRLRWVVRRFCSKPSTWASIK